MTTITETLEKLGKLKELAGTINGLTFTGNAAELDENNVNETTRQAVFELAETLNKEHHGKLIIALAASHAAKYGESALPEKVQSWLQRHEWVRTVAIAILTLIAAWAVNSCTYTSTQTAQDGSTSTRYWALDAATARDLVKLYGVPMVPTVEVNAKK